MELNRQRILNICLKMLRTSITCFLTKYSDIFLDINIDEVLFQIYLMKCISDISTQFLEPLANFILILDIKPKFLLTSPLNSPLDVIV